MAIVRTNKDYNGSTLINSMLRRKINNNDAPVVYSQDIDWRDHTVEKAYQMLQETNWEVDENTNYFPSTAHVLAAIEKLYSDFQEHITNHPSGGGETTTYKVRFLYNYTDSPSEPYKEYTFNSNQIPYTVTVPADLTRANYTFVKWAIQENSYNKDIAQAGNAGSTFKITAEDISSLQTLGTTIPIKAIWQSSSSQLPEVTILATPKVTKTTEDGQIVSKLNYLDTAYLHFTTLQSASINLNSDGDPKSLRTTYAYLSVRSSDNVTKHVISIENINPNNEPYSFTNSDFALEILPQETTQYASSSNRTLNEWTDSLTLVAQQYTVSFNKNGGSGTAPASQSGIAGTQITLPGANGLTKSGYKFAGWSTQSNGSGTSYSAGATYTISGNITLYAKWNEILVSITVDPNGGKYLGNTHLSVTNVSQGTILGEWYGNNSDLNNATRDSDSTNDYTLDGWYYGNTKINTSNTTPINSDITIQARWTATPKVTESYYWYIGTNEYTLNNYTSLTKVSAIPETGTTSANRQVVYCVVPSDKSVTLKDGQFTIVTDVVSNNEVNIYKTVSTFNGTLTYEVS